MDRIIEQLRALITTHVVPSRGLKRVYNGHPMRIPNDSLPSVIIRGVSMRSAILDTTRNQEIYTLQIMLVHDARKVMNVDDLESTIEREIRKVFEERQAGGNELMDDTIMAVVEKQFLSDKDYNLNLTVDGISFGADLDSLFDSDFPAFYGVMDLTVTAIPHGVRTP